jgi:methionine sulfoxide reductase catalytic subunit
VVPVPEAVPPDPLWTAKQDSVALPKQLGLPGLRHSIGLARWWHLGSDVLWLVNGAVFYVLLFTSTHWRKIVPTSWDVFPTAVSVAIQYLSLDWPTENGWVSYNSLQQLAYFVTVFIAAPAALITGLGLSPALSTRFRRVSRPALLHPALVGIAKWGGVSMNTIMDVVRPLPEAKWAVFYSLGDGP